MTERQPEDELAEFAAELKLLAEAVLERVEPVLRRSAAAGRTDWESCSWCPICAAAALIRGERHDVLAAIADHGTAIVTVLREALAGVPVEPVRFDPETGEPHEHSPEHADNAAAREDPESLDVPEPDDAKRRRFRRGGSGYVDIPVTVRR